ncbi:MAG TPA: GNAT family N-acetyltransferase [Gemmataceae bacterium]|nr:GNAT family N-acetyltransferase [Gemmataceae bacterium]
MPACDGLETLKLERILGLVDPANHASRRVLERIGMAYERMGRYYNADLMVFVANRSA